MACPPLILDAADVLWHRAGGAEPSRPGPRQAPDDDSAEARRFAIVEIPSDGAPASGAYLDLVLDAEGADPARPPAAADASAADPDERARARESARASAIAALLPPRRPRTRVQALLAATGFAALAAAEIAFVLHSRTHAASAPPLMAAHATGSATAARAARDGHARRRAAPPPPGTAVIAPGPGSRCDAAPAPAAGTRWSAEVAATIADPAPERAPGGARGLGGARLPLPEAPVREPGVPSDEETGADARGAHPAGDSGADAPDPAVDAPDAAAGAAPGASAPAAGETPRAQGGPVEPADEAAIAGEPTAAAPAGAR